MRASVFGARGGGLYRRDFARGVALVNAPGAGSATVTLPQAMTDVDGTLVMSVTLAGGSGAILTY